MKDELPPEKHDRTINAHLRSGNIEISAADWMASPSFEPLQGNTLALFVVADRGDELASIFDKLADGSGSFEVSIASRAAHWNLRTVL